MIYGAVLRLLSPFHLCGNQESDWVDFPKQHSYTKDRIRIQVQGSLAWKPVFLFLKLPNTPVTHKTHKWTKPKTSPHKYLGGPRLKGCGIIGDFYVQWFSVYLIQTLLVASDINLTWFNLSKGHLLAFITCMFKDWPASGKTGSRDSDDVTRSLALSLLSLASFSDHLRSHEDRRVPCNAHMVFNTWNSRKSPEKSVIVQCRSHVHCWTGGQQNGIVWLGTPGSHGHVLCVCWRGGGELHPSHMAKETIF